MNKKAGLDIRPFKSPLEWRRWLQKHHASAPGLWLKFYKKASGVATVTYAQALDEALASAGSTARWLLGTTRPGFTASPRAVPKAFGRSATPALPKS